MGYPVWFWEIFSPLSLSKRRNYNFQLKVAALLLSAVLISVWFSQSNSVTAQVYAPDDSKACMDSNDEGEFCRLGHRYVEGSAITMDFGRLAFYPDCSTIEGGKNDVFIPAQIYTSLLQISLLPKVRR